MFLAFDDTDSTKGMCTTFLATEMVRAIDLDHRPSDGWCGLTQPCLEDERERCMCIRFGKGKASGGWWGASKKQSFLRRRRSRRYRQPFRPEPFLREWSASRRRPARADPDPPSPTIYRQAVRSGHREGTVEGSWSASGPDESVGGGRGVIGATAAMSWVPHDRTYEVLAYRKREYWGSQRRIVKEDVKLLDERFPSTFNNYDHDADTVAIAPHSPCPILLGIRGDDPEDLPLAMASVRSEARTGGSSS
jgi:tRNA(Ile2)-agmatinylcytidine synthase